MADASDKDNTISAELEDRFPDYSISGPVAGTYGEVWILSRDGKIVQAIKIIAPTKKVGSTDEELAVFEREMAISLKIPPNINVISVYGFVEPRLSYVDRDSQATKYVPALRMKGMQGSLEDWTKDPGAASLENRLIAFVQCLSGLKHLYQHGLEGHGDIKPSNFLYTDFRFDFAIREDEAANWPSNRHPYRVVVSDFGWSDAWVDLGEHKKVFRQYMAPERLAGFFHPEKSDVFSMGILLAELLLCRHPARNYKKATKSEGNWRRCCEEADWDLSGIDSVRLKRLIRESLNPSSEARIAVDELIGELCIELESHGISDLAASIKLFETHVYGDESESHLAWAAHQIKDLNDIEMEKAQKQLREAASKIRLTSILGFAKWLPLADALLELEDANSSFRREIEKIALGGLIDVISKKDHMDLSKSDFNSGPDYARPFEALSSLAGGLLALSGSTYRELVETKSLSDLVRAALAFSEASSVRNVDITKANFYLDECARFAPKEATPHYFRAFWAHSHAWIQEAHDSSRAAAYKEPKPQAIWIDSLRRALELEPEWGEPRGLLDSWIN